MTRFTKMHRKKHVEATPFEVQPLAPKSKKSRHRSMITKVQDSPEVSLSKRALRRNRLKKLQMICFVCRKSGHSVKECPQAEETKCFKCGQDDHTSSKCKIRTDSFPFATCFTCKKVGHLTAMCPMNERGLYPDGGGCRFCGSVRHLAKDCKPTKPTPGLVTLGKIDTDQGGDDDDVFLALQKIESEKSEKPAKHKKVIVFK